MTQKIWQPIVNCGYRAGEMPSCFPNSFSGFETEEECDKWIDSNQEYFSQDELGGCVYPQEFEVENPTIIDADENVICICDDEPQNVEQQIVYVVQSFKNLSCYDTETCFAVVGVADNKERAKEMLKEEVQNWFDTLNERFYDEDDEECCYIDHKLSTDSQEDFPDAEWYRFDDRHGSLDIFCEVNILEKTINA